MRDPINRLGHTVAVEGEPPCRHLVDHNSKRPDVRARVHLAPHGLFRRHVTDCAHHDAGARLNLRGLTTGCFGDSASLRHLGQTEVQYLHTPARREHDVGGFDIAVRDAVRVRFVERVGYLCGDVNDLFDAERPARDACGECLAFNEFERDEAGAFALADLVNVRDVRMAQGGRDARLLSEAAHALVIHEGVIRQEL